MVYEVNKGKIYIVINDLYQYKLNLIKREICNYKEFEIPVVKIKMNQENFLEWFMGKLSSNEIPEIYKLIQTANKRSSDIKSILQTIALALVDIKQV